MNKRLQELKEAAVRAKKFRRKVEEAARKTPVGLIRTFFSRPKKIKMSNMQFPDDSAQVLPDDFEIEGGL